MQRLFNHQVSLPCVCSIRNERASQQLSLRSPNKTVHGPCVITITSCLCCFAGLNDFLDSLGLGLLTQQLKDLDLGELMDTPPPGVDEAIAISKVKAECEMQSCLCNCLCS